MPYRSNLSRWDMVVVSVCFIFLVVTAGAVGPGGHRRAKEALCLANLHRWAEMFDGYTSEHDGHFNPGWAVGETELWMNALRPYYQDQHRLLLCPAAAELPRSSQDWGVSAAWSRNVDVPGGGEFLYVGSYGINSWTNDVTTDRGSRLAEWFWRTVQNVERPSGIPVFADSMWHDAWPRYTDAPMAFPIDVGWGATATPHEINHFCIERHAGGVNCLFMDWSARKVGLKELWTLKWHRTYNIEGPWTKAGGVMPMDWPQWMAKFKDF